VQASVSLSEAMKDRAFKFAALAVVLATGAFAQAPAAPSDESPEKEPSPGLGRLASYKVPASQSGEAEYKAAAAAGGVRTMPEYRVTEFRMSVFRDRDLYTKSGMDDLSFKRHPGLYFGNVFKLNEAVAYETFMRDDWNRTKSDYRDMAHAMALGGDPGEGRMIMKAINDEDVFMRAESEDAAAAPAIGRFQIASAETSTRLLELPEETIDIPFIKKTW
jgi:hypothetical protein